LRLLVILLRNATPPRAALASALPSPEKMSTKEGSLVLSQHPEVFGD
jgi:hypothetical protein